MLRSHWVLVALDLITRCIVGFGITREFVDGISVCRMFNDAIFGQPLPKRVSTDHDPLFRFHRWLAHLRVLEIEQVKTVPYVPVSHPYVERLIGTIRREFLDRTFFWNGVDLTRKLEAFRDYYRASRPPGPEWRHTGKACRGSFIYPRQARSVCVALALPWPLPDAGSGVTTNSPPTGYAG